MGTYLTYKIPLIEYREYFFEYNMNIDLFLFINKISIYLKSKKIDPVLVMFYGSLIIGFLILICLVYLLHWVGLKGEWMGFTVIVLMILVGAFIVVSPLLSLVFDRYLSSEMPYRLVELINDERVIEANDIQWPIKDSDQKRKRLKPIPTPRLDVLALQKGENISFAHKYIPGVGSGTHFSDVKKDFCRATINGNPILNKDCKYLPWKFQIVDYKNKMHKDEKIKIEKILNLLWESYLYIRYSKIKYREKLEKTRTIKSRN
ncbi:MAG: hypothetical protein AABX70_04680 [Nanoarchaeota archaeon]